MTPPPDRPAATPRESVQEHVQGKTKNDQQQEPELPPESPLCGCGYWSPLCDCADWSLSAARTQQAGHLVAPNDSALLDTLELRGVVSIYFADGSQLNPGSQSLRAALIDASRVDSALAVDRSRSSPNNAVAVSRSPIGETPEDPT